jgi:5-methyltetrahydrofolate--homocysteine methyltransferase
MRGNFIAEHRAEYAKIRERLANKQPKAAKLSYAESIENGFKVDATMYHQFQILWVHKFTNYHLQHWLNILTGHHSLFLGAWQVNSRKS